jgi:hypothetical protein
VTGTQHKKIALSRGESATVEYYEKGHTRSHPRCIGLKPRGAGVTYEAQRLTPDNPHVATLLMIYAIGACDAIS